MAGVDALDKMLSSYRPKMRSKNVVEFIFAFVEYGVVVGWKLLMELHTATSDEPPHLEFRRQITIHLLHARPFVRSHPGLRSYLPIILRTSHGHYLLSCAQGRCPKMDMFSAVKSYTEIVFRPTTV
ncbi:hypothetical protein T06_5822 [Trichinella sp. T6]|nr:hypothetical protein T06_5822 [Trichinella sp. T6]